MTEEQKPKESGRSINTGGGAYVEGQVDTGGGTFVGRDQTVYGGEGGNAAEIAKAFGELYKVLEKQPEGPDKTIATQAVKGLEEEARKGEQADEKQVAKWFNFLADTVPDVAEVAIRTFINPIDGLSTVFRKIAEKAKGTAS